MKLHFQYNYKCEFKKSKEAFIIIQKYPLSCYVISDFWRTLTGNCDKQNIMFLCIKYIRNVDLIIAWHFQYYALQAESKSLAKFS